MIQEEIEANSGFDSNHIFYQLIYHGLKSAHATPRSFHWPDNLVDFANSVEAQGGTKTCNLIRGPGAVIKDRATFWQRINIPFPSKSTRQRLKPASVKESGVITSHLRNLIQMSTASTPLQSNDTVVLRPICLSRDAMAIKPSGDFDIESNTIVGMTHKIDLSYVKENPLPDPDLLKRSMYTEAGAVIGTALDSSVGLLVANDFLTSRTSSDMVFETLSSVTDAVQTCESCLRNVSSHVIENTTCDIECDSVCYSCLQNIEADLNEPCDECSAVYFSPYPQLRPCSRCVRAGRQCHKLVVVGLSMDCESNNAAAMKRIHQKSDIPSHMLLLHAIPDAVHAGKKVFRASANWWLLLDGYRINNSMLRTLRQFDKTAAEKLKPAVSDSALRNRDRMDYGAILECTDPGLHSILSSLSAQTGSRVTTTVFPDPFWRSKHSGILTSASGICQGN